MICSWTQRCCVVVMHEHGKSCRVCWSAGIDHNGVGKKWNTVHAFVDYHVLSSNYRLFQQLFTCKETVSWAVGYSSRMGATGANYLLQLWNNKERKRRCQGSICFSNWFSWSSCCLQLWLIRLCQHVNTVSINYSIYKNTMSLVHLHIDANTLAQSENPGFGSEKCTAVMKDWT